MAMLKVTDLVVNLVSDAFGDEPDCDEAAAEEQGREAARIAMKVPQRG